MTRSRKDQSDYDKRPPAHSIVVIKTDGSVIRADDPASARLSCLIEQTLGDSQVTPESIGTDPVVLSDADNPGFPEEVRAALAFAQRAS
jgi:hypothetical protein